MRVYEPRSVRLDVAGVRMADLDIILKKLRLRRNQLARDLVEVEKAIAYFERAKSELDPDLFSSLQNDTTMDSVSPSRIRNANSPGDIANAVRDVLLRAKKPMKRGDIVRELASLGMVIIGKNPNKNLGTILWRHSDMFVPIGDLGYWVKGVRLEGVYEPSSE